MDLRAATCMVALCFGGLTFGQDASGAHKLAGTWIAQAESGKAGDLTWVFEDKPDALKITHSRGAEKLADFECNTMGRNCDFKDAGKKATVSMWFSGPKLVELETRGPEVVKRRFAVTGADALEVEVIPISPGGKTEVLHFKRAQIAAHNR